ncbi:hypothetical protein [Martelella mediterranea]|uniref:Uncharacterized protein n=1 Tax=Martelella mediterranea TaxID=293089 RepID=A0A4R3NLV9_9HYPH|nr:hypothetical protein [Martelella mediterranea]TCT35477.1 hypothetical protein EDC90_10253 [Martelella mediterranea]
MAENDFGRLSLFAPWPRSPVYDGGIGVLPAEAGYHDIEPKAKVTDADDRLRLLLNDLTTEMRAQFAFFRRLRLAADRKSKSATDDAGKELRADVKAAADAMSLIIRTLEKADELQRRLAAARQSADDQNFDSKDYADARAHFLDLIEKRAEELAERKSAKRSIAGASAKD